MTKQGFFCSCPEHKDMTYAKVLGSEAKYRLTVMKRQHDHDMTSNNRTSWHDIAWLTQLMFWSSQLAPPWDGSHALPFGLRLYFKGVASRSPPQMPIHWRTTKRLQSPNLVAVVKLSEQGQKREKGEENTQIFPQKSWRVSFHSFCSEQQLRGFSPSRR